MLFPGSSFQTPSFGFFFFRRNGEKEWRRTGLNGRALFNGEIIAREEFERTVLE
jgi:hypothetical protein